MGVFAKNKSANQELKKREKRRRRLQGVVKKRRVTTRRAAAVFYTHPRAGRAADVRTRALAAPSCPSVVQEASSTGTTMSGRSSARAARRQERGRRLMR